MEQKTKRLWIRLSPDEEAFFRRKAARYKTVSAMVRDAVRQFDDTATRGKIDAINRMTDLYLKHQQELNWLGGNFNQTVKRANELAIGQQLTPQFFEQVPDPPRHFLPGRLVPPGATSGHRPSVPQRNGLW